ncbi:class I SAM-dependent methyltransferase [Patulibacter minatonensis]|uniref:class I SAM-dependent methyltransferase n=1 Tax=Patulibacter minatonensis TaxID=298163 RepID=UPI0006881784|nr:class I SAM-dependent methyltransferase [Patulibacter minatonensis]
MTRRGLKPRIGAWLADVFARTEEENRRVILEVMERRPGATLVDLGCGDGQFTTRVASAISAGRTVGVDFYGPWIDEARARGVDVKVADMSTGLPFDDDSVEVIHSNQVIEHLAKTDLFLQEIQRVLRPDGYAVVSTNNLASWHNVASLIAGYQPSPAHVSDYTVTGNRLNAAFDGYVQEQAGQQHLRIFTGVGLEDLAKFHGLTVQESRTAGFYPFSPRVARRLARMDRRHGAFLVQRFGKGVAANRTAPKGIVEN